MGPANTAQSILDSSTNAALGVFNMDTVRDFLSLMARVIPMLLTFVYAVGLYYHEQRAKEEKVRANAERQEVKSTQATLRETTATTQKLQSKLQSEEQLQNSLRKDITQSISAANQRANEQQQQQGRIQTEWEELARIRDTLSDQYAKLQRQEDTTAKEAALQQAAREQLEQTIAAHHRQTDNMERQLKELRPLRGMLLELCTLQAHHEEHIEAQAVERKQRMRRGRERLADFRRRMEGYEGGEEDRERIRWLREGFELGIAVERYCWEEVVWEEEVAGGKEGDDGDDGQDVDDGEEIDSEDEVVGKGQAKGNDGLDGEKEADGPDEATERIHIAMAEEWDRRTRKEEEEMRRKGFTLETEGHQSSKCA